MGCARGVVSRHGRGALMVALTLVLTGCGGALRWPASRVFPRFQTIHRLWVLPATGVTDPATVAALASLEGNLNRPRPRLYVEHSAGDAFWAQNALPGVTRRTLAVPASRNAACGRAPLAAVAGVRYICAVLRRFPTAVRGLVIYDPAVPASLNVATTVAGVERGMLVTPQLAATFEGAPFHLKVLRDLSGMHWASRVQAYDWAMRHLWAHTQHRLLFSLSPGIAGNLREYAVATRGFVFWLHPRQPTQRTLLKRILKSAPRDTPVLGWWTNEPAGVGLASRYHHFTVATDFCDNLSVFGAFPQVQQLRQTVPPKLPKLANRLYVSVEFSDGDNLQFDQHRLRQLWASPGRRQAPAAYTIQPWAAQAAPTILRYYYRTATSANLFVSGPSGPGYFYPSDWGGGLSRLLALGKPLLHRTDIRYDEVWNYGPPSGGALPTYARTLHPGALLLGMGGTPWIRRLDGTVAVENAGFPGSVSGALRTLRPCEGGKLRAAPANLAQGVRGRLSKQAPSGTRLLAGGMGAVFSRAEPAGAAGGLQFTVGRSAGYPQARVQFQLSGSGDVTLAMGSGGTGDVSLAYHLHRAVQTVRYLVPLRGGAPLSLTLEPSGPATVRVGGLQVRGYRPAPLRHPVFVNLYVDAWKFTPQDVQQLAERLGPSVRLVRLDQLLALWRRAAVR